MSEVEFFYEGKNIIIQCNQSDKMKQLFQRFFTKANVNPNSVIFIYSGNIITNDELTFSQLSNKYDKNRNKMNIIVTNSSNSSSSQFQFIKWSPGFNESMKEYAKMAILLALQQYPDNNAEQTGLIKNKFDNQYGGSWICAKYKVGLGGISFDLNNYMISIIYGDFKFIIFKSN